MLTQSSTIAAQLNVWIVAVLTKISICGQEIWKNKWAHGFFCVDRMWPLSNCPVSSNLFEFDVLLLLTTTVNHLSVINPVYIQMGLVCDSVH